MNWRRRTDEIMVANAVAQAELRKAGQRRDPWLVLLAVVKRWDAVDAQVLLEMAEEEAARFELLSTLEHIEAMRREMGWR